MTAKHVLEDLLKAYDWTVEEGELEIEEDGLVLTLKMTTSFQNDEQKEEFQKKGRGFRKIYENNSPE